MGRFLLVVMFSFAACQAVATVKMFSFDHVADLKKWTLRDNTALEHVNWPDGTPGPCGKLIFKKYVSGERWPGSFLTMNPPVSWLVFESLRFDVYAPEDADFYVHFRSEDVKTTADYPVKLTQGINSIVIPMADLAAKGLDLNAVAQLHLGKFEPSKDTVIYVGDMTLVKRDSGAIRAQVSGALAELKRIELEDAPPAARALFSAGLGDALAFAGKLAGKPTEDISSADINQLDEVVEQIKQKRQHALLTNSSVPGEVVPVWASSLEKIQRASQRFLNMPTREGWLDAAQGEGESVQLALYPRRDITDVTVSLGRAPTMPDGTAIPNAAFSVAPVGFVWCDPPKYKVSRSGYWPDPILSYAGAIFLEAGKWQAWWLDVNVPSGQKPGVYSGELLVVGGKLKPVNVPFKLKVRGFELKPGPPYPMTISVSSSSVLPCEGVLIQDELPATPEKTRRWRNAVYDMMLANRLKPDSLYNGSGTGPLSVEDVKYRIDHGAGSFNVLNMYLSAVPVVKWLDAFVPKYREAGVLGQAYLYGFDELHESKFPIMRETLRGVKAKYPDIPVLTTACDDSYGTTSGLNEWVDGWIPTTTKFEQDLELLRQVQKSGKRVWWYIACGPLKPYANFLIEYPAIDARLLMGAMFWKYRPDGFLYYSATGWADFRHLDAKGKPTIRKHHIDGAPLTDWHGHSYRNFSGDGLLLYPAKGGPIASTRLKNIRDGLDDYIYLRLLSEALKKAGNGEAAMPEEWRKAAAAELAIEPELVETLTVYTRNPETLFAKRSRIADLLEAYHKIPGNPKVDIPPYSVKTPLW